jgi:hypothetical protein
VEAAAAAVKASIDRRLVYILRALDANLIRQLRGRNDASSSMMHHRLTVKMGEGHK